MKTYTLALILFMVTIISFGQGVPSLDSLIKPKYATGDFKIKDEANEDFWREKDEIALICIDNVLKTADGSQDINRNEMMSFINEWIFSSKYDIPYQDKLAKELYSINMYVWFYYMLGVSREFIVNKDNLSDNTNLHLAGLRTLRTYFEKKDNFSDSSEIELSDILKNKLFSTIMDSKSDRQLKKFIKQYAAQQNV